MCCRLDGVVDSGVQHDGSESSPPHLHVREDPLLRLPLFARVERVPNLLDTRRLLLPQVFPGSLSTQRHGRSPLSLHESTLPVLRIRKSHLTT